MALGKGLSALISEDTINQLEQAYIPNLSITDISPNPYQPRIALKGEELVELADSIRENGIIEPLIVTKSEDGGFHLIAGERRWRAAKLAKMNTVPVVIKEASPQQMLELAIIENVQRKDLNALEEALAFQQLREMYNMGDGDIAAKVGFSRSVISNKIRLLALPEEAKKYLLEEKISEGHARALLGLQDDQTIVEISKSIYKKKLSVRATEELVRRLNKGAKKPKTKKSRIIDELTMEIEGRLQSTFGKNTKLFRSRSGGKIVIPFKNDKQLEKIYNMILQDEE